MPDRYEVNHDGLVVQSDGALCSDIDGMLNKLFSQYGWSCKQINKEGSCRTLSLTRPNGTNQTLYVYCGTVRNEARNPYEKKIQLGTTSDPRNHSKDNTIILGIYVYGANDTVTDAVFVGYPIDDNIRYDTNPSIRGTFVNKILLKAKNEGFVYDKEHNSVAFRAEFIFYYLSNFYNIHYSNKETPDLDETDESNEESHDSVSASIGENILLYGVPGSGKSHYIKTNYPLKKGLFERVVFHPDYTYSDFIGQVMPRVEKDGDSEKLKYVFSAGPFTRILKSAIFDEEKRPHILIIEEINRGNAPAIFGEVFQLLDRDDSGESDYGITNFEIASELCKGTDIDPETYEIKIPSNLWILATMNTSDQNVFTLDTAFQRRWIMKHITNDFNNAEHADVCIEGSTITWKVFAEVVNEKVIEASAGISSVEDKRLGAYFAKERELKSDRFAEKVLKYLWDDAFKMDTDFIFSDEMTSLDCVIEVFKNDKTSALKKVLKDSVYMDMMNKMNASTDIHTSIGDESSSNQD